MVATSRRSSHRSINIWPGFVDALAALLMVVIFVLMVFMVAQFYLSNALSGRDQLVDRLNRQIFELDRLLSLERGENADLRASFAQLSADLQGILGERDTLSDEITALQGEQLSMAEQLANALARSDALESQTAALDAELVDAYQTIDADRETIELRLREIASLQADIQALQAVRGNLEVEVAALSLALSAAEAEAERLGVDLEETLSLKALLDQQLAESRAQNDELVATLELRQGDIDVLTAALAESRADNATLIATLDDRQADIDDLTAALEAARLEAAATVAELELSQADIDTLTAALEDSLATSATLTATLEQRDADIADLKAALEASQTRTAEAVARLELSQADIDALTAALEESGGANATLSATLESRDASIAELQAALEASQTRTADAIAQLQLSQADIAVLTAALDEARLDTNLLTVAVEDREADLAALRETLLASEADRAAMAAALEETRAAGDQLSNRLRLSDEEILRLRDLLASRELAVGTLTAERDAAAAQRDQTAAQRDAETARADGLTVELRLSEEDRQRLLAQLTAIRDRSQVLAVELSDAEERTALAQRAIDERDIRIDELVAAMATTEAALDEEVRLSTQSRVLVAELNQRIDALRDQLAQVQAALEASEAGVGDRDIEIANLNARLNQALVRRIEELNRYRSEFFGRLREVIGRRDDIRVVGDRFVFQSEVLFPSGSATLQVGGKEQLDRFADTLLEIAADFPPEIDWILRVDGHTDRVPIRTPEFPSNWELSTARATEVVKFLIERGVPQDRLAAAGFGEFQPLDTTNTFAAFRRNRRIELKLDQR